MAKTGLVCDGTRAAPRTRHAREFFERYAIEPASAIYSPTAYEGDLVNDLALAWAHRSQYFYSKWCLPGNEYYVFTQEDWDAFRLPDFLSDKFGALPDDHPARQRWFEHDMLGGPRGPVR